MRTKASPHPKASEVMTSPIPESRTSPLAGPKNRSSTFSDAVRGAAAEGSIVASAECVQGIYAASEPSGHSHDMKEQKAISHDFRPYPGTRSPATTRPALIVFHTRLVAGR